jgi:hypothetical protein
VLIDVEISGEGNVIKKETDKVLKYEDLTKELQHMMNIKKTKMIPVIIGAAGTISKSFRKYLSNVPGKHKIKKKKLPTKATLGKFDIQMTLHRDVFL